MENLHILHTVILDLPLRIVGCGEIIFFKENATVVVCNSGLLVYFALFQLYSHVSLLCGCVFILYFIICYYFNNLITAAGFSISSWFLILPLA